MCYKKVHKQIEAKFGNFKLNYGSKNKKSRETRDEAYSFYWYIKHVIV